MTSDFRNECNELTVTTELIVAPISSGLNIGNHGKCVVNAGEIERELPLVDTRIELSGQPFQRIPRRVNGGEIDGVIERQIIGVTLCAHGSVLEDIGGESTIE